MVQRLVWPVLYQFLVPLVRYAADLPFTTKEWFIYIYVLFDLAGIRQREYCGISPFEGCGISGGANRQTGYRELSVTGSAVRIITAPRGARCVYVRIIASLCCCVREQMLRNGGGGQQRR